MTGCKTVETTTSLAKKRVRNVVNLRNQMAIRMIWGMLLLVIMEIMIIVIATENLIRTPNLRR